MKYFGHRKLLCELSKLSKLNPFWPPWILNEHWCIYSCLQIPPRENWFQYVRRVYATATNFPCIITLIVSSDIFLYLPKLASYWFLIPNCLVLKIIFKYGSNLFTRELRWIFSWRISLCLVYSPFNSNSKFRKKIYKILK